MPRYRRPVPEPLDTNAVPVVLLGMALWAAAGLVMLLDHRALARAGDTWWLWSCLAGVVVGGALLLFERWRRRRP